jgi:chemosensory pili system protein ChpE/L-lysine exporter family protein LysE/ArgO
MLTLFVSAVLLGLVFNAAPGAVFAETIRYGVRGGFRPALAVQLGSLVGDALWAAIGLAGVGLLLQLEALRLPVAVAGLLYLLWLAQDSWREAARELHAHPATAPLDGRALRAGVLLSVTNPQNVAYWAALGSAMGAVGVADPTPWHYGTFFGGFMTASVLWSFLCAALVAQLFRLAGDRWSRLTYRACAVAFLALALLSAHSLWLSLAPPGPLPAPAITRGDT